MQESEPEILNVMEQCVTCRSFIDLNEALMTDTGDVVCLDCLKVFTPASRPAKAT